MEEKYVTDFYYAYNAFSFEFYVRYTIKIDAKLFKMTFLEFSFIKSHELKINFIFITTLHTNYTTLFVFQKTYLKRI